MFGSVIAHYCEQSGCAVIGVAESLQGARSMLGVKPPDLVMLDLELPDGSGMDFAKWLRLQFPSTKICLVSSKLDDEALRLATLLEVEGIIDKTEDRLSNLKKVIDCFRLARKYYSPNLTERIQWILDQHRPGSN